MSAGPALVCASGHTFWEDYWTINQPDIPAFAVNGMLVVLVEEQRRVDHVVSHHAFKLSLWARLIPSDQLVRRHSSRPDPSGADPRLEVWPAFVGGGSSALLAVRIARALRHDPVYVAGVPLDNGGHLWSNPRRYQKEYGRYRRAWIDRAAELRGHVVAPSGFLAALLRKAVAV